MIDVLIADDHELFREGLRRILEEDERIRVVGESSTGPDTVSRAKETRPHIVLLDLEMPGRGGLAVAEEIKSWDPGMRILVLTSHQDEEFATRSLRLGVEGFLTKDRASAELLAAVHRIHGGGKYIPPELAEKLAFKIGTSNGEAHEALSDRELQVFRMIAAGRSSTEIAHELNLSVKTVSTYRTRIREKMDLRNTAEIVRYAMRHGLVVD
jgi:DNA-binding NarL/FixJ family response regulator